MGKYTRKEFKKKFPGLAKEMGGPGTVKIKSARSDAKEAEKATYTAQGYEPTAVDYIRRCNSEDEAIEIIDYLEKQGTVVAEYAKKLKNQLKKQGLRSFGQHKEPGCYEHD